MELPSGLNIHPVFHISRLKKYIDPTIIEHRPNPPEPPPVIIVEGEEEFEVEKILDKRINRKRIEYLVKWKGYPEHDAQWEPLENLQNAHESLEEYESRCGLYEIKEGRAVSILEELIILAKKEEEHFRKKNLESAP